MAIQKKKKPVPVEVVGPAPVDVKIVSPDPMPVDIVYSQLPKQLTRPAAPSLKPDTTEAQDKVVAGQRRINMIWEITQAIIAVMITTAIVYCEINKIEADRITNAFFLIVAMYFVRTNHSLVGGVGHKPAGQTR